MTFLLPTQIAIVYLSPVTNAFLSLLHLIQGETSAGLEVSLSLDGLPIVGNSIAMCVKVTNLSNSTRVLIEHVSAQVKEYNRNPMDSFWKEHKEVHIQPGQGRDQQRVVTIVIGAFITIVIAHSA